VRARLRATCAEGCWLGDFTGPPLGWGTSGECGSGSRGSRRRGARACVRRQLWPLRTAVLLVPLLYVRGKGGTRLAQMLVRYSLFPQDPPTNGLCSHELFVLARAVSATPPSIVIVALVLGGPERVRVVLSSSSSSITKESPTNTRARAIVGTLLDWRFDFSRRVSDASQSVSFVAVQRLGTARLPKLHALPRPHTFFVKVCCGRS